MVQANPETDTLNTTVKPVVFDDVPGLEEDENPEHDLIVLTTCLGTLIREIEDKKLMPLGKAMEAAHKALERIYMTNDIKLTLNDDEHIAGTVT